MTTPIPQTGDAPPVEETPTEQDRLHELRAILLAPEQAELAALRHRLDDPATHAQHVSETIAEALALRAKHDHKLQTTLQPLIEEALRVSVARDPKMLATALFPIIGEAVRKAVAHALQGMFDSLNLMLDRGLSLDSWKWRFEAWRTGRSFGEVALTHSLNYRVEQVFLIHRETGLLLNHVAFSEGVVQDTDLISGMLTAIQDFVRDSFSPQSDELEVLQVGVFKLWLQHSPLLLLAAVVSGQPPPELRDVFTREIEAIHHEFAPVLHPFDGDTAALAAAEPNLRRCLLGAQRTVVKKSSRTFWRVTSAILLVFAIAIALRIRDNRRWSRYLDDLRAQPGIAVISATRQWLGFTVTGLRDPLAVDPRQLLPTYKLPQKKVLEHWEPYQSLAPAFEPARRLAEQTALLKRELERETIHFDLDSSQLPMSQYAALENVESDYRTLARLTESADAAPTLNIFGHTDRTGREERNVKLAAARAQTVANALLAQGIPAANIRAAGVADLNPNHADPAYPQELDRRVTFILTAPNPKESHP